MRYLIYIYTYNIFTIITKYIFKKSILIELNMTEIEITKSNIM